MEINRLYIREQLEAIASEIKGFLLPNKMNIILFYGDLGLGKTAVIKYLFKLLGVKELVKSPTYSIQNEYEGVLDNQLILIHHWDLYRLGEKEAIEMLEDFLSNEGGRGVVLAVEWSERLGDLGGNFLRIYLTRPSKEELKSAGIPLESHEECRKITIKCP